MITFWGDVVTGFDRCLMQMGVAGSSKMPVARAGAPNSETVPDNWCAFSA
ncbi:MULTISPECIES: hypothetical protein [unclassified Streptomyces]